jgi:EAL domain-containing protein (putative c-di-GMP-specific phosphodiesterase class I)
VYQPIVHLESGTLSGVEALCRFDDGRAPDMWFKQCEDAGLGAAMDRAVIDVALEDLHSLPPGYLSLNLSVATLSDPQPLIDRLRPAVAVRPIVLELTEHSVVEDYETVVEVLRLVRDAGVQLAVDDAGAGYSTFQHILRLRPDIIKLDRSITHGINEDPARRALTSALVIFAAEINASVVAEGIETEDELTTLRTTGVARGQGFWLGRPAPLPLPAIEYVPAPYVELLQPEIYVLQRRLNAPVAPAAPAPYDATVAVLAHSVLSSMASVASAIELLRAKDGTLPLEEHRALCSVMQRQVGFVMGILEDLVRGLPPDVILTLDALADRADEQAVPPPSSSPRRW